MGPKLVISGVSPRLTGNLVFQMLDQVEHDIPQESAKEFPEG